MSNTSSSSAPPPSVNPWAEVFAHDRVVRYRRTGAGMPVLLMLPEPHLAPLAEELMRVLSANFRLIVPELPSRHNAIEWVAEFLEGLGTSSVTLIASGPLCMAAIELALRDADQVSRLVLLPEGEAADGPCDSSLVATFGAAEVPALIIRPGLEPSLTAGIIARFVGAVEQTPG
jgi:hypothetical protein